jgi:hypothetical protein
MVMVMGLLRGLQDTRRPMLIAAFSYWAVGVPASYGLGFPLGLGGPGIWLGLVIGLTLAAVSGGLFLVPRQAMIQGRALPERRGRVLAASGVLNGASATLGQLVLLALAWMGAPLPTVFILIAAGSAIIVLTDILRPAGPPPREDE